MATPIGNLKDVTQRAIDILAACELICCEDTRHSGMLLKNLGIVPKSLLPLHKLNEASQTGKVLKTLLSGADAALISDAGTPLISDPGEKLVAAAIEVGVILRAIPGPSSILAALVVSGLNLERWSFEGFFCRKGSDRFEQIRKLKFTESVSLFFESPKRIEQTLAALLRYLEPERKIVIARELTKVYEEVWRGTLAESVTYLADKPSIKGEFILIVDRCRSENAESEDRRQAFHMLHKLFINGYGRQDALKTVSTLTDVAHRELYDVSLEIWRGIEFGTPDANSPVG